MGIDQQLFRKKKPELIVNIFTGGYSVKERELEEVLYCKNNSELTRWFWKRLDDENYTCKVCSLHDDYYCFLNKDIYELTHKIYEVIDAGEFYKLPESHIFYREECLVKGCPDLYAKDIKNLEEIYATLCKVLEEDNRYLYFYTEG